MNEYYYQIKGKKGKDDYSFSNWSFPPIFSGKVYAKNKIDAKRLIEEEYRKKFPLRVLNKDIENNEFLLKIEDMKNKEHLHRLFENNECIECGNKFRRIDLYNDSNERYKGTEFCSYECMDKNHKKQMYEVNESMSSENNIPVIYKITNKRTNMCYIGQTIQSFTLRWWQHIKWGVSGCKFHEAMRISKITDWKFEVIHICKSKGELDRMEQFYINQFNSIDNGYNSVKVIEDDKKNP